MKISVVIPTYNRARTLKECINALFRQNLPAHDYEIIVVDDGSRDETAETLGRIIEKAKAEGYAAIALLRQKNSGQGIARNLGISKAKGKIVVMIGDDIIVERDFLTEHLRYHLKYSHENDAVLGFTDWHPRLTVTPFMRWLTNGSSVLGKFGGHQFAYEKLENRKTADYNFFYTSNISLKRTLLKKYGFDPVFSGYGWEDIELGYRLEKEAKMKLHYNRKAVGHHDHAISEAGFAARMRNIGRSARVVHAKHPELKKVPSPLKKAVFRLIASPVAIAVFRLLRNMSQGKWCALYYYALSKRYFLEGLEAVADKRRDPKIIT